MKTTKSADKRILSVDVLRGFDMIWLVGITGLALAIVKHCGGAVQDLLLPQMDHADWIGFTFYDLIFPLFEFVMGMSVVFSLVLVRFMYQRKIFLKVKPMVTKKAFPLISLFLMTTLLLPAESNARAADYTKR